MRPTIVIKKTVQTKQNKRQLQRQARKQNQRVYSGVSRILEGLSAAADGQ
jgi:hypothetical protein